MGFQVWEDAMFLPLAAKITAAIMEVHRRAREGHRIDATIVKNVVSSCFDIKKIPDARGKALMLSTFEYIQQAVDADERQVPVSWIAYLTAFLYNKSLPASYVATLTKILKKLIDDDVTPTIAEIGTKLPAIENLVPMLTRMHEAVRAKARHVLKGVHRASPVPLKDQWVRPPA